MTTDMAATSVEDATNTYDQSQGTTSEMGIAVSRRSWAGESFIEILLAFMCVLAFTANLAMFISLLVYRQAARKTVNTFVCNQTALDAAATFFAGVKLFLLMSGYLRTKAGVLRTFIIKPDYGIPASIVCIIRQSDALLLSAMYGAVYGLVVITAERFVKIVHPIAHRNHYKQWMTYMGVALPWLIGLLTSAVPALAATRFVDNSCITQAYASMMQACATRVALFSWRFVIPLVIFIVCYWKIISTLRRKAKVAASHGDQPVAGPATAAAASGRPKPPSKAQKNVIKMMVVIISCFVVCWLPYQIAYMVRLCGLNPSITIYYAFVVISFINPIANPFIYATVLYQFLSIKCIAWFRRLLRRENQVESLVVSEIGTAQRRNTTNVTHFTASTHV